MKTKILDTPILLSSGDYLVTLDYGTSSPGYGKDVKQTIASKEELEKMGWKFKK